MTRKRFKKLLMAAKWCGRNDTEEIAALYLKLYGSYQRALQVDGQHLLLECIRHEK